MRSAFVQITAAIETALKTDPAVSPAIYRARDRHVPEQAATALNVQFDGATPSPGVLRSGPVDWTSRFTIECFARTTEGTPDEAVDPLLVAVYERLSANSTLDGLVDDLGEPLIEAEYSSDGKKTGWVRMTYAVAHRTNNMKLEQS